MSPERADALIAGVELAASAAPLLLALALISAMTVSSPAFAGEPPHVYGPGGPLPAMKEAAAVFERAHGVQVIVGAGPPRGWVFEAMPDADLIFSGSEHMMSDFIAEMPDIDPASAHALYLRPAAILVRPGNPEHITGVADLLNPGHRILAVNGAGQQGLWEDVAGRPGSIESVRPFRANIAKVAANSGEARQAWIADKSLDAWLIWTIWQKANPTLADQVPVEPRLAIYRDNGVALTKRGEDRPEAREFAAFLASPTASAIFAKWGWIPATK
jgi:accessory colonization factor AcfC